MRAIQNDLHAQRIRRLTASRIGWKYVVPNWIGLLIFGLVGLAQAMPVVAQRLIPRVGLVEDSYFGMHMHYIVRPNDFGRTTSWPTVRFGSWRLHDAYVKWSDLEPRRGQWNFSVLDRYVAIAEKHGVSLLYTFGSSPRWASARADEPSISGVTGSAAEPADLADWESYVRTVVSRYRGRIRSYEIWNEPWFKEIDNVINKGGKAAFYSGTAVKMVELGRAAHRIIKEIDPEAKVLTPAFDHAESGARRLDLYLSLGGTAITDAVAFHFYTASPESMLPIISRIRAVMDKHGIGDRELWNTETGFVTENPDEPKIAPPGRVLSEREAAAYVARSLVLAAAAGVRRFYWYAWDNKALGLTVGRGRVPNMASRAYDQTGRWLRGAAIEQCESSDRRQWVCTIRRASRVAWIVWRTEGEGEWRPPVRIEEVERLDEGVIATVGVEGIRVDSNPVLVKADRGI